MRKRGKEQFLLFSTIFCCLLVDLCVKTGTRFSLRDKQLFEIGEVEITRVDCICLSTFFLAFGKDAIQNCSFFYFSEKKGLTFHVNHLPANELYKMLSCIFTIYSGLSLSQTPVDQKFWFDIKVISHKKNC